MNNDDKITGKRPDITSNNMAYALFNPYLFQEAKANIDLFESVMMRNGFPKGSKMINLIEIVRDHEFVKITPHLIYNEFTNYQDPEKAAIWKDILDYREMSKEDIERYRTNFKRACINELLYRSNEIPDPVAKLEFLQTHSYKDKFSTEIFVMSFEEAAEMSGDEITSSGIKAPLEFINKASPTGDYLNSQLIAVSAPPGGGKSLFLQHQAILACEKGKRTFYAAAGDLIRDDFLIRLSSMINETPIRDVYLDLKNNVNKAVSKLGSLFNFACFPSQKVTAKEYVSYCMSRIDDFDVFMLDYDANLAVDAESMYEGGGILYDLLTELSRQGKLVFVASQPKINMWENEVLGMNALNESARKQHILDMIITISRSPKAGNHVGIVNIAKNRRGTVGVSSPYIMSTCGKMVEITKDRYQLLNNNPNRMELNELSYRNLLISHGVNAEDEFVNHMLQQQTQQPQE